MDKTKESFENARAIAEELKAAFSRAMAGEAVGGKAVEDRSEAILLRAIELGKKGLLKIAPEDLLVSATHNCNLKCLMCHGHLGMSGPKLSLEDATMLFGPLADKDVNFGKPKLLDMTWGEPTLNQNLSAIYHLFKDLFPQAKIVLISNATIPVRGRIREAFELADRVGISVDGATKETYEKIRQGSVFENVVRNIKDIVELKKQGGHCESLQILFVAMDQNIHELPAMVRLIHSLGVPSLFVQASETRSSQPFNFEGQNITLTLSKAELASYVIEAKAEAERLGVSLALTSVFQDAIRPASSPDSAPEKDTQLDADFEKTIKTCRYLWFCSPAILQSNEKGIYLESVCCHMPHHGPFSDVAKHPELNNKSIIEVFNSEFYWNMRSALADGSLAKESCAGCQYYRAYQWTPDQLKELEAAMDAAEQSSQKHLERMTIL